MKNIDTTYGSDQNGVIWAYHFFPGSPAKVIDSHEVLSLIENNQYHKNGEFLWLHLSLSNSSAVPWLKQKIKLPDAFFELLQLNARSCRLEQEANCLVAIIHDVLFDFTFDSTSVASSYLYLKPGLFVSARLRPLRSLEKLRTTVRQGQLFASSTQLLANLLVDQAYVFQEVLHRSTMRVDDIEDNLLANRISFSRSELGVLRRVLVRLQRLLAPEPASFFRLLNRPPNWISEPELHELRQAAEEFSSVVGDAHVLIERVKLLQEELAALVNEQTNGTLHVLTLVTVLALPINLVAGLFGMNVGGMPLASAHFGFPLIVSILSVLTVGLAYYTFLKRRN